MGNRRYLSDREVYVGALLLVHADQAPPLSTVASIRSMLLTVIVMARRKQTGVYGRQSASRTIHITGGILHSHSQSQDCMAVRSMSMRAEQQSSFHLCIKHVTHREVTHTRRNAIKKLRPRGSVARRQPLGDSEFAWVFHGRCCFTLSSRTGSSIKRLPGQRDRRLRRHSSK